MTGEQQDDGAQQMGYYGRVARCQRLAEKIENGDATDEEVEEFRQLMGELLDDWRVAANKMLNAYGEMVQSVGEAMNEALEPLLDGGRR